MKKLITICILASGTTLGLFAFMAFLVNNEQIPPIEEIPDVVVQVTQLPDERPAQQKPRFKNDPPPPKPMPRSVETPQATNVNSEFVYQVPGLKLDNDNTIVVMNNNRGDNDARPIVRVNPKYPIIAMQDGIEGWVKLRFDINAVGAVENIEVIDAQPKRIFNKEARRALRKWKYQAKSADGEAMIQQGLIVQLDFNINQQS